MQPNKKIKVLEAIRQGEVGGGESHIIGLVENIDRSTFDPVVLSFTDGQMIATLNKLGIRNHVIRSEKALDVRKWKEVRKLLKDEKIDLVHVHGTRANSNVYWAAKQLNLPIVYTIHGWSFHDDQSWLVKRLRIFFEGWITNKVNRNISVSASNQKTGKENIANFNSIVINNGIDLKRFDPCKRFKDVKMELGIDEKACVVGFIGRITVQKDPFTLVRAFKKVVEENKDVFLLIIGDGELKEETVQLARKLQIETCVVFESFREDVPDILNAIDIFCLPSLWEGLPIALLEAMAMAKAVVATAVDGSADILKDKENGLIVPVQNEDALSKAVSNLVNNKFLRTRLGEEARKTVSSRFDVEKMTRQIEKVYLDTLA